MSTCKKYCQYFKCYNSISISIGELSKYGKDGNDTRVSVFPLKNFQNMMKMEMFLTPGSVVGGGAPSSELPLLFCHCNFEEKNDFFFVKLFFYIVLFWFIAVEVVM